MHVRIGRWLLSVGLFAFVFVVNPAYLTGCRASDEPSAAQRARAQAELRAKLDIIDGTPSWTMMQDGEEYEVFLALAHASGPPAQARLPEATRAFTAVAHACGSYTLYNSASACATSFELPLEGTLTVRRARDGATIVGDLPVTGMIGSLDYSADLNFGAGDRLSLVFDYEDSYELGMFSASMLGAERIRFDYRKP